MKVDQCGWLWALRLQFSPADFGSPGLKTHQFNTITPGSSTPPCLSKKPERQGWGTLVKESTRQVASWASSARLWTSTSGSAEADLAAPEPGRCDGRLTHTVE